MSTDNKNLQSFLDEFYRDDSTKIIETVDRQKRQTKTYLTSHHLIPSNDDDEIEEPKPAPIYLFTRETVQCDSNLNILDFPMELLIRIFSYLNPTDLRVIAITCRQFFEATKYHKFMDHRVLNLNKITFSDWEAPISDLNESSRVFHHVNLYLVHFPATSNYFWYIFGSYIQSLTLERCIVKKSKFLEILRYLENLSELTICECNEMLNKWPEDPLDEEVGVTLTKLKRINLQKITILKPHVFDFLFDMAPNLDSLEVSLCFKKCVDSVLIKKMVEHSILALVRKKHQIKSLYLHGTPIDDLDLMKLCSIEGLSLEKLSITFTGRLLNPAMVDASRRMGLRNKKIVELGWILEFLRTHQNMVYLDLSESLNLLDYCLVIICKNMTNLKVLKLQKCVMISDFGMKELSSLRKLEQLDITGCEKITDKGIQEGVAGRWADWKENMTELYIGSNAKYTEHTIGYVATMFLRLTVLDVSSSPNCMTDHSLQLVIKHLSLLRSLNINCCGQVSDAGMTGEGFEDSHWRQNPISRLQGLQSLQLCGVYQITDESLLKFKFLELRELSLAHCQMITEDGIFELIQHCPSLEELDLTDCHNMNDACVEAITNKLRRLKNFSIACCNQITDRSIDSIATNCNELKILHIRGCNRLTADALRRLHRMTWLKYVYSN